MKLNIYSDRPLGVHDFKTIADIFRESKCPNESMFYSLAGFKKFDGKNIFVGTAKPFVSEIYIESKADSFD